MLKNNTFIFSTTSSNDASSGVHKHKHTYTHTHTRSITPYVHKLTRQLEADCSSSWRHQAKSRLQTQTHNTITQRKHPPTHTHTHTHTHKHTHKQSKTHATARGSLFIFLTTSGSSHGAPCGVSHRVLLFVLLLLLLLQWLLLLLLLLSSVRDRFAVAESASDCIWGKEKMRRLKLGLNVE